MAFPAVLAAMGRAGAGAGAAGAQAGAMTKAASSATQLVDAYNRVSAAGYMFKGQLEGLFGKVAGQATLAASALKSLADPLTALTELSNPAAVKQFTLAFSDTMAVMGRVALPVVNALTGAMRIVGDAYARAEPFLLRVTNAVGSGIKEVFGALEKVWKQNGPVIDMMTTAMVRSIKIGTQVALVFVKIVDALSRVVSSVAKFFGFRDYSKPNASAKGSAVRQVTIGSSGEDIAKKTQEAAFMQAMQPAGGKAETDVDILDGIRSSLTDIRRDILDGIRGLPKRVADELDALANKVIAAIPGSETVGAVGGGIRKSADSGMFGLGGMLASALTR